MVSIPKKKKKGLSPLLKHKLVALGYSLSQDTNHTVNFAINDTTVSIFNSFKTPSFIYHHDSFSISLMPKLVSSLPRYSIPSSVTSIQAYEIALSLPQILVQYVTPGDQLRKQLLAFEGFSLTFYFFDSCMIILDINLKHITFSISPSMIQSFFDLYELYYSSYQHIQSPPKPITQQEDPTPSNTFLFSPLIYVTQYSPLYLSKVNIILESLRFNISDIQQENETHLYFNKIVLNVKGTQFNNLVQYLKQTTNQNNSNPTLLSPISKDTFLSSSLSYNKSFPSFEHSTSPLSLSPTSKYTESPLEDEEMSKSTSIHHLHKNSSSLSYHHMSTSPTSLSQDSKIKTKSKHSDSDLSSHLPQDSQSSAPSSTPSEPLNHIQSRKRTYSKELVLTEQDDPFDSLQTCDYLNDKKVNTQYFVNDNPGIHYASSFSIESIVLFTEEAPQKPILSLSQIHLDFPSQFICLVSLEHPIQTLSDGHTFLLQKQSLLNRYNNSYGQHMRQIRLDINALNVYDLVLQNSSSIFVDFSFGVLYHLYKLFNDIFQIYKQSKSNIMSTKEKPVSSPSKPLTPPQSHPSFCPPAYSCNIPCIKLVLTFSEKQSLQFFFKSISAYYQETDLQQPLVSLESIVVYQLKNGVPFVEMATLTTINFFLTKSYNTIIKTIQTSTISDRDSIREEPNKFDHPCQCNKCMNCKRYVTCKTCLKNEIPMYQCNGYDNCCYQHCGHLPEDIQPFVLEINQITMEQDCEMIWGDLMDEILVQWKALKVMIKGMFFYSRIKSDRSSQTIAVSTF